MIDLRGTNRDLDSAKFTQEKDMTKQLLRVAALEQQLKDKEDVISKMTSIIDGNKAHLVSFPMIIIFNLDVFHSF